MQSVNGYGGGCTTYVNDPDSTLFRRGPERIHFRECDQDLTQLMLMMPFKNTKKTMSKKSQNCMFMIYRLI
jgi:hypothetical protein